MAVIAVAGANGNVAPHILDALIARGKHTIIVLSRKPAPETPTPGIAEHKQVDYSDQQQLIAALQGVNVVLSFILPYADKDNVAQKGLIDASIAAGVRRFAPSEWAVSSDSTNPFYSMRDQVRQYLEQVNTPTKRLQYTCFQPGLFLDYFTYPKQSTKHLKITQHYIDFGERQAILVDDGEQPVTFTLIDDLANMVAEAIDYDGEWPADGGVSGWRTTSAELLRVGERVTGAHFDVHRISSKDLAAGKFETSWCPILEHPSLPKDKLDVMSRQINFQAMKGVVEGAWTVSDSWNRTLPNVAFRDPVKYLEEWWSK